MTYRSSQFLHCTIGSHSCCIDREGSHHANSITFEKGTPTSNSVLLSETAHHSWVLEISKFIRLHQSFDIVERIIEDPVESTTHTTSDHRYIDRNVAACVGRSQVLSYSLNQTEIEAQSCRLSDSSRNLPSIQTLDAPLLKYLYHCVHRSSVNLVSLSSLNLNSDPGMFDGTLHEIKPTTPIDENNPVTNAANVLSYRVKTAGTPF